MSQPEFEQEEETPLDPAMDKIRRKMVLLQLISGGVMFLCLMAVLGAIVYKLTQRPETPAGGGADAQGFSVPAGEPLQAQVPLPAGFAVDSVSLSGNRVLFYGQAGGTARVLIFDLGERRIVADLAVAPAAP